jgi:predicted nucleotidyltransferase
VVDVESQGVPSPKVLADLVQRIVETVHPLRVILFGSAAEGRMGPDSDLDVLVIVPNNVAPGEAEAAIYRHLWGLRCPVDVIAVTEETVRKYGSNPYLIFHTALVTGKDLYRAAG